MSEACLRMTEGAAPPMPSQIAAWVGGDAYRSWERVTQWIERNYPGVFKPDWQFGGKKHGWGLRYKKGKSFCTLIPEKNRFVIQIVFGAEERASVEKIRHELSAQIEREYAAAKTYHDGKWLFLAIDSERTLDDVKRLLSVKRKSRKPNARRSDEARGGVK